MSMAKEGKKSKRKKAKKKAEEQKEDTDKKPSVAEIDITKEKEVALSEDLEDISSSLRSILSVSKTTTPKQPADEEFKTDIELPESPPEQSENLEEQVAQESPAWVPEGQEHRRYESEKIDTPVSTSYESSASTSYVSSGQGNTSSTPDIGSGSQTGQSPFGNTPQNMTGSQTGQGALGNYTGSHTGSHTGDAYAPSGQAYEMNDPTISDDPFDTRTDTGLESKASKRGFI